MQFHTIGIIVKPESDIVRDTLTRLVKYLHNKNLSVLLDESATGICKSEDDCGSKIVDRKTLATKSDLVVTIGGDGTILNAARSITDYEVPLVGINIGRLGFLADVPPGDFETALDKILEGDYLKAERFMLSASVLRDGKTMFSSDALNDVVLHVRDVARMIDFEIRVDGKFVNHQRADGLIVATPTGSTAYALSSGGPIMHAGLQAIALVPICPHTLSSRPLVIKAEAVVEIIVGHNAHAVAQVTCDGQISHDLEHGDIVKIQRKSKLLTLLHPPGHSYFEILRAKLHWS
jgi:NAD+ kinase